MSDVLFVDGKVQNKTLSGRSSPIAMSKFLKF